MRMRQRALHRLDQFQKLEGQDGEQHRVVLNTMGGINPSLKLLLADVRGETKGQKRRPYWALEARFDKARGGAGGEFTSDGSLGSARRKRPLQLPKAATLFPSLWRLWPLCKGHKVE